MPKRMLTLMALSAATLLPHASVWAQARIDATARAEATSGSSAFSPRRVRVVGAPSAAVDAELVQLLRAKPAPLPDVNRHQRIERLIEQGAYVQKASLLQALRVDPEVTDYRSFITLYVNGGFRPSDLQDAETQEALAHALLRRPTAPTPQLRTMTQEASLQLASFLVGKVQFGPHILDRFDHFRGLLEDHRDRVPGVQSPDALKVLLDGGLIKPQSTFDAFFRSKGCYVCPRDASAFPPGRARGIEMLLDAGAKVSDEQLAQVVRVGWHVKPNDLDAYGAAVTLLARQLPARGPALMRALTDLEERVRSASSQHGAAAVATVQQVTLRALNGPQGDVGTQQRVHALREDLHRAIDQRDTRRVDFLLQRGHAPDAETVYRLAARGLGAQALAALQTPPVDLKLQQLADAASIGSLPAVVDWAIGQRGFRADGLETAVLRLLRTGNEPQAQAMMQRGANAEAVMRLAIDRLPDDQLERTAAVCGQAGVRLLVEHRAAQAAEARRREEAALARARAEEQQAAEQAASYRLPKRIGDRVCRDGRNLLGRFTLHAHVERIESDRLQLRIAQTHGYMGSDHWAGQLTWAGQHEWRPCS